MRVNTTKTDAPIWFVDNLAFVRVSGEETEGRLALVEAHARRGHMPPLHVHHGEDETFVVLQGRLRLYVGADVLEVSAGSTALAPKDVPHTFRVESQTARWLVACTPAGFENFVAAVGQRAPEAVIPAEPVLPSDRSLDEIADDFGIEVLGPPGALPS